MPCGVQRCEDPYLQSAPHCGMCEATRWTSCMRAWGCRVHSQACLGVRGQQWEGQRGDACCFDNGAPERAEMTNCFLHAVPPSQPSHTVLTTNPHTLPHHALQTLHTPAHIGDNKGGKGWVRGLVAGSATTMRHRFLRKSHARNFRGVVCIHIQSPKHLESTSVVEFPHHQA